VHFLWETIDSRTGSVDPGNAGTHQDFCRAAEANEMGVYQLLGVYRDGHAVEFEP
jgi:hypothetical protein